MSEYISLKDILPKATTIDEIVSVFDLYPLQTMEIDHASLYKHLTTYQKICHACKKHNIKSIYGIELPEIEEVI